MVFLKHAQFSVFCIEMIMHKTENLRVLTVTAKKSLRVELTSAKLAFPISKVQECVLILHCSFGTLYCGH